MEHLIQYYIKQIESKNLDDETREKYQNWLDMYFDYYLRAQ